MKRGRKNFYLIGVGGFIIALMVATALLAPWVAIQDPQMMSLENQYTPPSWEHPFGRDQNGSDVFSQVVYGARISLYVSFAVTGISLIFGLLFGSLAGFFGGWIDMVLMRLLDMLYAFPGFLLAIALVAVLGPSIQNLILALSITGWTGYARLIRGEFLHLMERDYIQAAVALGAGGNRVVVMHVWPNLVGPLVVQASFGMAGTIIGESGLSFLGLGAPPTEPTWGSLLNAGTKVLIDAPHVSIFPGLAIVLLVLGFNIFGDGLRDWLDPKKSS